jgi:hypothetical protein
MPRASGGTNWGYIFAGSAVALTVIVNLLGWLTSGNEKLEKRVSAIEDALTWKYVSKELAQKDLAYTAAAVADLKTSKVDRDVYDLTLANHERRLNFLRDAIRELEKAARK